MTTQILKCSELTAGQIQQLAQALSNGAVAVFATDTVYGLGTGAHDAFAVQQIYTIKHRPFSQPLQLLVADVTDAQQVTVMTRAVKRVAQTYWPGGLTLILPASAAGRPLLHQAAGLGLRVPAHAVLRRILAHMSMPLAATSANLHGQPVITDEKTVIETFDGLVDYILTDGTLSPTASTVLDVMVSPARLLREGDITKAELGRLLGTPVL